MQARGNTEAQERELGIIGMFTVLIIGDGFTGYAHVKTYQMIHFKYVYLIVCQLYLHKLFKKEKENCRNHKSSC